MISLVKFITEYSIRLLGKRGELRNKDVLLAPKLSSPIRMSEFLSSRFLLFKELFNRKIPRRLLAQSRDDFCFMDTRVKHEYDRNS